MRSSEGIPNVGPLFVGGAHAQSQLHYFEGAYDYGEYGRVLGGGGDVNGDGFSDLIVSAIFDLSAGNGRVEVRSGFDGSVLHDKHLANAQVGFGGEVALLGDIDGDGVDDFASSSSKDGGRVHLYSGLTGAKIRTLNQGGSGARFGSAIAAAGDINQDGLDDLVVGAYVQYDAGQPAGWVYLFSGDSSIPLRAHIGPPHSSLGYDVVALGDVDGDSVPDYGASAPDKIVGGKAAAGRLYVWSGATGDELFTVAGTTPDQRLGTSLDATGDVNGDGIVDMIATSSDSTAGSVWIYSGLDGGLLRQLDHTAWYYGADAAGVGDVNGDGIDDQLVGSPGESPDQLWTGAAYLYSGADGRLLTRLEGSAAGDNFGFSVERCGDTNGDGLHEFVVGAYRDDGSGINLGSATVYAGWDARIGTTYCSPATPNSTGLAGGVIATGTTEIGDNDLVLSAVRLPSSKAGYFLASQTQGQVTPPGAMGDLCLGGAVGRFTQQVQVSDRAGSFWIRVDLDDLPGPLPAVQSGDTFHFQAWYRDNVAGPTSNFTDAVSVTFL